VWDVIPLGVAPHRASYHRNGDFVEMLLIEKFQFAHVHEYRSLH